MLKHPIVIALFALGVVVLVSFMIYTPEPGQFEFLKYSYWK